MHDFHLVAMLELVSSSRITSRGTLCDSKNCTLLLNAVLEHLEIVLREAADRLASVEHRDVDGDHAGAAAENGLPVGFEREDPAVR